MSFVLVLYEAQAYQPFDVDPRFKLGIHLEKRNTAFDAPFDPVGGYPPGSFDGGELHGTFANGKNSQHDFVGKHFAGAERDPHGGGVLVTIGIVSRVRIGACTGGRGHGRYRPQTK